MSIDSINIWIDNSKEDFPKKKDLKSEIQIAQTNLENLREQNNPENNIKIQELEEKLGEFIIQKEAILSETREYLVSLLETVIKYINKDIFWDNYEAIDWHTQQTKTEESTISWEKEELESQEQENKTYEESRFNFYELLESREWENFKKYKDLILKRTSRIWIDPWLLLKLMIKEWSNWDLRAGPWWRSSAVWLGQITNWTWEFICDVIAPRQYWINIDKVNGRFDAESQIKAMCIYLDYCSRVRWVDHKRAVVYYHMWPGKISDSKARIYLENNPAIARYHTWDTVTVASYEKAAVSYYLS